MIRIILGRYMPNDVTATLQQLNSFPVIKLLFVLAVSTLSQGWWMNGYQTKKLPLVLRNAAKRGK